MNKFSKKFLSGFQSGKENAITLSLHFQLSSPLKMPAHPCFRLVSAISRQELTTLSINQKSDITARCNLATDEKIREYEKTSSQSTSQSPGAIL